MLSVFLRHPYFSLCKGRMQHTQIWGFVEHCGRFNSGPRQCSGGSAPGCPSPTCSRSLSLTAQPLAEAEAGRVCPPGDSPPSAHSPPGAPLPQNSPPLYGGAVTRALLVPAVLVSPRSGERERGSCLCPAVFTLFKGPPKGVGVGGPGPCTGAGGGGAWSLGRAVGSVQPPGERPRRPPTAPSVGKNHSLFLPKAQGPRSARPPSPLTW